LKVSNNQQHQLWFFTAITALDIFGTDNNDEFDTCGVQYPYLLISILHLVARIFGLRCKRICLLNVEESGKNQKLLAFFTLVNMTYRYSNDRAGLPGVCSSNAMMDLKVPP
jgi:hypothetical protein